MQWTLPPRRMEAPPAVRAPDLRRPLGSDRLFAVPEPRLCHFATRSARGRRTRGGEQHERCAPALFAADVRGHFFVAGPPVLVGDRGPRPCRVLEGAPEWTVALARRCSAAMRPANPSRACSRGCTWPHELKMRRPERKPADRRACHLPVRRLALHCAVVRPPPRVAARGRRLRLTLRNTAHFQLVGQHGCARACGGNGGWGVGVAHGQRHHRADLQGVGSGGHGAARGALNRRTAPIRGMRIDRRRASMP